MPEVKVSAFKGQLPDRWSGRVREPSPYDDVVAKSFESAQAMQVTGVGEPGSDDRKAHLKNLRRSAEFHNVGIDVWPDMPEGIVFLARPKRERKHSEASEAVAS